MGWSLKCAGTAHSPSGRCRPRASFAAVIGEPARLSCALGLSVRTGVTGSWSDGSEGPGPGGRMPEAFPAVSKHEAAFQGDSDLNEEN